MRFDFLTLSNQGLLYGHSVELDSITRLTGSRITHQYEIAIGEGRTMRTPGDSLIPDAQIKEFIPSRADGLWWNRGGTFIDINGRLTQLNFPINYIGHSGIQFLEVVAEEGVIQVKGNLFLKEDNTLWRFDSVASHNIFQQLPNFEAYQIAENVAYIAHAHSSITSNSGFITTDGELWIRRDMDSLQREQTPHIKIMENIAALTRFDIFTVEQSFEAIDYDGNVWVKRFFLTGEPRLEKVIEGVRIPEILVFYR